MEEAVEGGGRPCGTQDTGDKSWVVCVWRTGRCDGRYLLSAWSSLMVYLSKASRPDLGPPCVC